MTDCCQACGRENNTEDEYCTECTAKHNLGKECMEDDVRKVNLACKLCLIDVLEWLETADVCNLPKKCTACGYIENDRVHLGNVIDVIRKTLAGQLDPESFLCRDEVKIGN